MCTHLEVGRDSSVGIGTRYGLDGPEIETLRGGGISSLFQIGPRAHPHSCTTGTGFLAERKSARSWL